MFIYLLLGLALLVGGALGMVEAARERALGPGILSFIVCAIGATVCLGLLFL
jgi:hypothetical protein